MRIVIVTHGNLLQLHALSSLISWAIVIGALYGMISLVALILRGFRIVVRNLTEPPIDPAKHAPRPAAAPPTKR